MKNKSELYLDIIDYSEKGYTDAQIATLLDVDQTFVADVLRENILNEYDVDSQDEYNDWDDYDA